MRRNAEDRMRNAESNARRAWRFVLSFILLPSSFCLFFPGCERNDMHNQPKHEPHEPSAFFDRGPGYARLSGGAAYAEVDLLVACRTC